MNDNNKNYLLWSPNEERIKSSLMYQFIEFINKKFSLEIKNFNFWQRSCVYSTIWRKI